MASLRKAINEKCKDCTYDPLDRGTWREQVEACHITDCELWEVRPISSGDRVKRWQQQQDESHENVERGTER